MQLHGVVARREPRPRAIDIAGWLDLDERPARAEHVHRHDVTCEVLASGERRDVDSRGRIRRLDVERSVVPDEHVAA